MGAPFAVLLYVPPSTPRPTHCRSTPLRLEAMNTPGSLFFVPVDVVHFNPRRPKAPGVLGRLFRGRLDNFGDVIGPILVRRIRDSLGLREPLAHRRLVAVGSILKMAQPGDTVWGAGVNGKSLAVGASSELDIRAVRGPRTRQLLLDAGAEVPEVYGDPALLWSRFWPRDSYDRMGPRRALTVIPNYNDLPAFRGHPDVVDPRLPYEKVIGMIARSDFVCGSSLHAIVFAESFGIPARLIRSASEPSFKYDDYYEGTGRSTHAPAETVDEAVSRGGEPAPSFDADRLLAAFPRDLWVSGSENGS